LDQAELILRTANNAEFTQLINEVDRVAQVTSYNNTALLSGYGNTVSQDAAVSTALASTTTGVVDVQIAGAKSGTYLFSDTGADNEITLGNGVTTQTLDAGILLDADGAGGVIATGSSVVANFDRLGRIYSRCRHCQGSFSLFKGANTTAIRARRFCTSQCSNSLSAQFALKTNFTEEERYLSDQLFSSMDGAFFWNI